MEYHWELREGSIHLRQGWLSVCMYVPLADMLKYVGKKGGVHFCIMVRAPIFFISLCFLFVLSVVA